MIVDIVEEEYNMAKAENLTDRWIEFFSRFQKMFKNKEGESYVSKIYIEQIKNMANSQRLIYSPVGEDTPVTNDDEIGTRIFQLDYQDLIYSKTDILHLYDYGTEDQHEIEKATEDIKVLCYQIRNHWDEANKCIRDAVFRILKNNNSRYSDMIARDGGAEKIYVTLTNYEVTKSLTELSSDDLDKFVRIKGTVPQFDDQFSIEIIKTAYRCTNCDQLMESSVRKPPKKCSACNETNLEEAEEFRKTEDFMYFVIQDPQDKMREGQLMPNSANVSVNGTDLVRSIYRIIDVGLNVAINGVVRLAEFNKSNYNVGTIEIEFHGIEILDDSTLYDQELRSMASEPISEDDIDEHYEILKRSIAPHIQGYEIDKEALLLQGVGSPPLMLDNGSRVRGDINIILLGDWSTAKTEFLKFFKNIIKGSVYVQGSNATKVGLTASLKDTEVLRAGMKVSKTSLDAGVYGMCRRRAVVCLDEIDKVASDQHYEAISTAMDDFQEMFIHKNAVHTSIKTHCGSLHAANPSTNGGMYDVTKDPFQQTNFHHWLWSRYDLRLLHLQKRDDASRYLLWKHKEKTYASIVLEKDILERKTRGLTFNKKFINAEQDTFTQEYLTHEIAYLKDTYDPILRSGTLPWIMMQKFWDRYNKISIMPIPSDPEEKAEFIPAVDERTINSITRLSQASARAHRRNIVTVDDMEIALSLVRASIGMFMPKIDEENEEMKARVSAQIILSSGIKEAIRMSNKEQNDKIASFYNGIRKAVMRVHNTLFNRCPVCKGSGHMQEEELIQNTGGGIHEHIPCSRCHGAKGWYNSISFNEFKDMCRLAGVAVYAEPYFKLLKQAKCLSRIEGSIGGSIVNDKALQGKYNIIRDLKANAMVDLFELINNMFGVDIHKPTIMKQAG